MSSGFLDIVNGTPYDWVVTSTAHHHINSWTPQFKPDEEFLTIPKKGGTARIYLEWDDTPAGSHKGEAEIRMRGPGYTFVLHAKSTGGQKHIWVEFRNFSVQGYDQSYEDTLRIDWVEDLDVAFILSGDNPSNFFPTNGPTSWMHASLPSIGNRPLKRICMPGTNSSGMCEQTGAGTAFANDDRCCTQWQNIHGQLVAGARYLDIQPCIKMSEDGGSFQYMCGRFDNTGAQALMGCQGVSGLYIQDVIDQINQFLYDEDNEELVIINLSRGCNVEEGYREFTDYEWHRLFDMLIDPKTGLQYIWTAPKGFKGHTAEIKSVWSYTLNDFIGKGTKGAAVVIISESCYVTPESSYAMKGIFNKSQGDIYKSPTNSDSYTKVEQDQLEKMYNHGLLSSDDQLFALSWTCSPPDMDDTDGLDGILRVHGDKMNKEIYSSVVPKVNQLVFPNILLVDCIGGFDAKNKSNGKQFNTNAKFEGYYSFQGRNLASLAMAINWLNTWDDGMARDYEATEIQARWDSLASRLKDLDGEEYGINSDSIIRLTQNYMSWAAETMAIRNELAQIQNEWSVRYLARV
ncbi:hypothetical protein AA313_de0202715 [Arthrobotrys entomopaga]|nr:hypothetical protein AA313_de0202715 [Arthrobotrys entomopaga]